MLPTLVAGLFLHLFSIFTGNFNPQEHRDTLKFELRHLHAVSSSSPTVIFSDVSLPASLSDPSGSTKATYSIQTSSTKTYRPSSHASYSNARLRSLRFGENEWVDWEEDEIIGPNVESRETLLELARMASNGYLQPNGTGWYNLNGTFNTSHAFGWEPEADGFRGHVFATPDNSTILVSIKGTSTGVFGGGGPTAVKDKINDNLLFSCCCARIDWTWTTVCGCYVDGWKCRQNCLEDALMTEDLFYPIGTNLYNNLTYMYPHSNIWLTGHSLGGALASLVGVTFGAPVVAFESPGDKLAARRLHLPSPPSTHHVTHVYHTADPIAMGTCNGVLSSCALGGYAMETHCHLGKSIVYDTVSNFSWSVNVRTHSIQGVIDRLLSVPWPPSVEKGREVPEANVEVDCVECYSWEFGEFPPA
ncbi:alpha/beta-hydrolase [Phlegmacium glaucopus]|nr:alpha/beta-hydrolase [Phlegmacium glaucopus]